MQAGSGIIDFAGVSLKTPAGYLTRCRLNFNATNHNQRDRRRRFYLTILHPWIRGKFAVCLISGTLVCTENPIRVYRAIESANLA